MIAVKMTGLNLEAFKKQLELQGKAAQPIAAHAINDAIDYARQQGAKSILDEVNFPPGYLERPDRFAITQRATASNLFAALSARHRPTSLGTFVVTAQRGRGVTVNVKGRVQAIPGAFATRLKNNNQGVALRVKKGESLIGRTAGTARLPVLREDQWGTVYLLYGPSVNQVFHHVSEDISASVERYLLDRFSQLYRRKFGEL